MPAKKGTRVKPKKKEQESENIVLNKHGLYSQNCPIHKISVIGTWNNTNVMILTSFHYCTVHKTRGNITWKSSFVMI